MPDMGTPVSSIRNLGPASEESFARAGIHNAETLRELGADEAYLALMRTGTRPHFIGYYVLVMGLQGRPWNDCKGEEKMRLRKRFDALKKQFFAEGGIPGIESILNEIGVLPAKPTKRA